MLDRRTVVAGLAGALPAAAIGAAPALASADAELVALGRELEPLVVAEFDASCDWAPRCCEVNRKVKARFGPIPSRNDPRWAAYRAFSKELWRTTGLDEAIDRQTSAFDAIGELAERIAELEAETVEGLRAKALLVLFEACPFIADQMSDWRWPDDGGATYSFFRSVAKLTGLTAFLDHYEAKFDQVAADIERAGGDGSNTSADDPPAA